MYKNILVPVLLDDANNNAEAFAIAQALAAEGAKFNVVHVMENLPAYATAQIAADVLRSAREAAVTALATAARGLQGAEAHMLTGHAGRTIVDYAKENDVDCIIIASHKPGLEDFFLGSTASRVVRHAQCAVHVIR